ncbi:MAG TPA: MarR family transcriptional regulator [Afipia sp.]
MADSRTAGANAAKRSRGTKSKTASGPAQAADPAVPEPAVEIGELSEFLGYSLKRAQLRISENFIRSVSPLDLTPAQFSSLLLMDTNAGRNQSEIAGALGIQRPNFVAMLDELERRDLCVRTRSVSDRRSHILTLTEKGRAVLARAKKLIRARHEARLTQLLGEDKRALLLAMLRTIAEEF